MNDDRFAWANAWYSLLSILTGRHYCRLYPQGKLALNHYPIKVVEVTFDNDNNVLVRELGHYINAPVVKMCLRKPEPITFSAHFVGDKYVRT